LTSTLALALLGAAPALAAFKRPFVRELTETPAGALAPRALTTDSIGDIWVQSGSALSEFDASGSFVRSLEIPTEAGLAIDLVTGNIYVANTALVGEEIQSHIEVYDQSGALLQQIGPLAGRPNGIAIDNSTDPLDPSAGDIYVSFEPAHGGSGIEKFSATGASMSFESAGSVNYVSGNKITGTPTHEFKETGEALGGLAIDSQGDIYVMISQYFLGERGASPAVLEYSAGGTFLRAYLGEETPGLRGNHTEDGRGGGLNGLAIDPVSNHVLVSVRVGEGRKIHEEAIDEFTLAGQFVSQTTESAPGRPLHSGPSVTHAIAADAEGLYVLSTGLSNLAPEESEHGVEVYGAGHFVPSLRLGEPSARTPSSATLNGSVDPETLPLGDCHFEYVAEAAFLTETGAGHDGFSNLSSGGSVPCTPAPAEVPADAAYHAVGAPIAGLVEGTVYRYRLAATSTGALGGTELSPSLAFTAPATPRIDSTAVGSISSSFADLRAQIDPLGLDTTYSFQYVDAGHYAMGAQDPYAAGASAPAAPADAGSGGPTGSVEATVTQQVGGLQPGTTYHYRVVARNAIGVTAGPDRSFTTLPATAPGLPDNRAYELVTPTDRGDAVEMFAGSPQEEPGQYVDQEFGYAASSGDRFLLALTLAAFGPFPAAEDNAYLFSRGPTGWSYTSLAAPSLGAQSLGVGAFDPIELSRVGVNDEVGSLSSATGFRMTSLLGAPGGPYAALHVDAPVHTEPENKEQTQIVGGSRDLNEVVMETKSSTLCPGSEGLDEGGHALCAYAGGRLSLLNVDSQGKLLSRCGAVLGQGDVPGSRHGAVSADGTTSFFTAPDPYINEGAGCWNKAAAHPPELYMRSGEITTEVSAPAENAPEATASHFAMYVGASEDGSRVFFVSEGELTADDAGIHDPELYEYNARTSVLSRISHGEAGASAGDVHTVPAISADGSAVYFTAFGALARNATALAATGQQINLYRYDTTTGATRYVATVEVNDYPKTSLSAWGLGEIALGSGADWYTTPNGRYLLFATTSELSGYATHAASPADCPFPFGGASSNGHCYEVYRYDAATAQLTCLSCDPNGAAPVSNALFMPNGSTPAGGSVRALSDDGSYAFFETADPLTPSDTNGTLDVYEWHEGRVALISSGRDPSPSFFLGASSSGSDVFIGTHANLVPWEDTASKGNIYDVRICTVEEPCPTAPAGETAQCEGGACQGAPATPIDATPASLAFSDARDLTGKPAPMSPPVTKRTGAGRPEQTLARVLRVCQRKRSKTARAACTRRARRRYGLRRKGSKSTRGRR
jgi:hypothetical protein